MLLIELEDKIVEIVKNLNKENFLFDFLSVYDFPKATITRLRNNNFFKENGEIFLKNKFYFKYIETDLLKNYIEIEDKIKKNNTKVRYIIITDYKKILAKDMQTSDSLDIDFEKLPQNFHFFLAWNGIEKANFEKENPMDIKAAERFVKIYDELIKINPNISKKSLNIFLIRILFCLFAEDTEIFEKGIFTNDIKTLSSEDGNNLNEIIGKIFEKMATAKMNTDKEYLKKYPYVNGNLFTEFHNQEIKFNKRLRKLIIDAGELLNWSKINPDILGSMLQTATDNKTRGSLGMHYTSVSNIMKVIKPLFLDSLYEEFYNIKNSELKNETKVTNLKKFLKRIGKIKFFDPACGSGNFLIITYKEMRRLEIKIYEYMWELNIAHLFYFPSIELSQFYGIEIDDFAHDVAMLSLWITDHQMNTELKNSLNNANRPTLPLKKVGAVVCANALKIDWKKVCPHNKDDEIYIFGNPPYLGAKLQDKRQKEDLELIFKDVTKYKKIDYIGAWFYLGSLYIKNSNSELAFVTTNSVSQGEQVDFIWSPILNNGIEISFAYQSFKWQNSAKYNAGVTVAIIGLKDHSKEKDKYIFDNNNKKIVKNISPYLTEGDNVIVESLNRNTNLQLPLMVFGNMPRDGGHLLVDKQEYEEIITNKDLQKIFKKYVGSSEFINSTYRYCIWINNEEYLKIKDNKILKSKFEKVKQSRMESNAESTKKYAEYPYLFVQRGEWDEAQKKYKEKNMPTEMLSIIIPRVSSENRIYVPMGIVYNDTIISDSAMAIYDAPLWLLGLLQSRMHMVWLKAIGGKLKTDYRYSAGLVYNTFPVPELTEGIKSELEERIIKILDIRDMEGGSLAELYGSPLAEKNPKPMNENLKNAHEYLDRYVDGIYRNKFFSSDEERLSLLLEMHKKYKGVKNE